MTTPSRYPSVPPTSRRASTPPSRRPSAAPPKRSRALARSYWALLGAVLLVPIALSGKLGHSSPLTRAKPALAARTAATHPVAAHPAAPEEAPPAATCGESPDPDCPLQGWMKANAAAALDAKDFVRLERALRRLVKLAPAGYEGWERTALEGADAAKQGDFAAVRVACKACHNAHRADYRRDHRADPLR